MHNLPFLSACSDSLNISVTCEQDDSYEGPYQVGNLTVTVNVSSSIETQGSDDNGCPQFIDDETHGSSHSGNGSASGESGGGSTNGGGVKESHDFHYRVCFPIVNGSHRYYYCMEEKSDNDTAQFTYNYQNPVESAAIFIEVFKSSKTKFRYTNDTVNITVDGKAMRQTVLSLSFLYPQNLLLIHKLFIMKMTTISTLSSE